MKPLTREWIAKAEGDLHSCLREMRARKHANYDSACFHAQQCVEKYLKARPQEAGAAVAKTHNLEELLKHLLPFEPQWTVLKPALLQLGNYAVIFRYPGFRASKADAQKARDACQRVRRIVRQSLGLKN